MKIEVGGVTYAGTFIDKDGHTVMVAMLDGTGMNALYFQAVSYTHLTLPTKLEV